DSSPLLQDTEIWAPQPAQQPSLPPALTSGQMAEHIEQLIVREHIVLHKNEARALAVEIRPDQQTELYVEIHRRDGGTEAVVTLRKGDLETLGAGWEELKSQLEKQDIRLAPLQHNAET